MFLHNQKATILQILLQMSFELSYLSKNVIPYKHFLGFIYLEDSHEYLFIHKCISLKEVKLSCSLYIPMK